MATYTLRKFQQVTKRMESPFIFAAENLDFENEKISPYLECLAQLVAISDFSHGYSKSDFKDVERRGKPRVVAGTHAYVVSDALSHEEFTRFVCIYLDKHNELNASKREATIQ